jgi:hypothetical protein
VRGSPWPATLIATLTAQSASVARAPDRARAPRTRPPQAAMTSTPRSFFNTRHSAALPPIRGNDYKSCVRRMTLAGTAAKRSVETMRPSFASITRRTDQKRASEKHPASEPIREAGSIRRSACVSLGRRGRGASRTTLSLSRSNFALVGLGRPSNGSTSEAPRSILVVTQRAADLDHAKFWPEDMVSDVWRRAVARDRGAPGISNAPSLRRNAWTTS